MALKGELHWKILLNVAFLFSFMISYHACMYMLPVGWTFQVALSCRYGFSFLPILSASTALKLAGVLIFVQKFRDHVFGQVIVCSASILKLTSRNYTFTNQSCFQIAFMRLWIPVGTFSSMFYSKQYYNKVCIPLYSFR